MNCFVIAEPDKCIGCRTCEVACALAHPIGAGTGETLSPANFRPRLKVVKGLKVSAPVQCRHCENAPCVNVCPTNALIYSKNSVQLVAERCIGCQTCVIACPFGAMEMASVPVKQQNLGPVTVRSFVSQAHKCDLCVDVADGPACIPVCPTKALYFVDPGSLAASIAEKREKSALSLPSETLR
jgi:electron transport protein HydN